MVEMGTYDDLLANGGLFAELHSTQFGPADSDASPDQAINDRQEIDTRLEILKSSSEAAANDPGPTTADDPAEPRVRPTKTSVN